ncbi:MAG: efflux RND transporter periplasmic adaptor subunit [Sphingobacteriales bacterium]|nr:MAG: efflux RND transporter periplasmic adaptor subunit [Sphingobacteriales bacterium]
MKKILIIPAIAILLLAACGKKQEVKKEDIKFALSDTMVHMIALDTVSFCNVDDELSLSGEVSFNENNVVKIFPRSSGQVTESRISLGDHVTKGQVLAVIRSADIAANYSDMNSASADVAIAKRQMETAESLYQSGINSEREYTEAKQNYQKALAAKNKIQSVLNINGGTKTDAGGDYVITSPIDGYVVEKKVAAGAFIRPDMGDNLFTISDLHNVWVYANVYESDIAKVKQGSEVNVIPMAYPDKVYKGKIDNTSQVLDPSSKAMHVKITLNNKDMLLKPDMFVKVVVNNAGSSNAVCVPTKALVSQDGRDYVVAYNQRDDMNIAQVKIAKTVGDKTYLINSNLASGQKLIVKNQLLVFNQLLNN